MYEWNVVEGLGGGGRVHNKWQKPCRRLPSAKIDDKCHREFQNSPTNSPFLSYRPPEHHSCFNPGPSDLPEQLSSRSNNFPFHNHNMSGADSPEIQDAYNKVRDDKDETNWLLISYAAPKGDAVKLTATGTGGLEDLKSHLDDSQAQYAYVRIEYANDTESTRVKFALIIWIGENTGVMRKAKVSIQSGGVKKVLHHHSVQVDARTKSDLDEKDIVVRLRKAGGADYNGGRG